MTISGHMLRMAAAANSSEPVPDVPGTPYAGGYYAGLIKINGLIYALICAPKSGGEMAGTTYLEAGLLPSLNSINDGLSNTAEMIAAGASDFPAADFCYGLTIGGFSDWYLPAKDELEILYRNLKPSTKSNSTSSGANASSVPPTTNYSSVLPAQTPAVSFKTGGSDALADTFGYWSSSSNSFNAGVGAFQLMSDGSQSENSASALYKVRAVRRVLI